jgi:coiled-coil domain-containing protein 55
MGQDGEMIIGQQGVKYGLQIRKPGQTGSGKGGVKNKPKPKNVFGGDEDEYEEEGGGMGKLSHVGRMVAQQAAAAKDDARVLEMQAKALEEDAMIFDYDSHVDSMRKTVDARKAEKVNEKVERKSKYIATLLETAEQRKREQDVLFEKRLEKERVAEEQVYGTTEKFLTSAYRKKLQEDEKWKAEQERKKKAEEENAVEKKGHMGDFYRNLFKSNVDYNPQAAVQVDSDAPDMNARSGPVHIAESDDAQPEPHHHAMEPPAEEAVAQDPLDNISKQESMIQREQEEDNIDQAETLKRAREEKIQAAKERYLSRKKKMKP